MFTLHDLNSKIENCEPISLVCPACHGELMLEKPYRRINRIRTGELHCLKGCAVFPIIYGVPVMLMPGQSADYNMFYKPAWQGFLHQYGKEKLMEKIDSGYFDNDMEITGPSVDEKMLKEVKRVMSNVGWQRLLKKDNTSDADALSISKRLSHLKNRVVMDIGCGGGFTTERVLLETDPSICAITLEMDFSAIKITEKRIEQSKMDDRNIGICADSRCMPFTDDSLTVIYTRNGFNEFRHYAKAIKDVYRVLKTGGYLITTNPRLSHWLQYPQRIGMSHEEQKQILCRLGYFHGIEGFIDDVKQAGFKISALEDILEIKIKSVVIVEAVKENYK